MTEQQELPQPPAQPAPAPAEAPALTLASTLIKVAKEWEQAHGLTEQEVFTAIEELWQLWDKE